MENPALPTADVLLDLWLDECSAADMAPIGIQGDASYRYFWSTWLQYLGPVTTEGAQRPAIPWYEAKGEHIVDFLANGVSERKAGAGVSEITRRRYWRLLDRIYSFAVAKNWVKSNPAIDLMKSDVPDPEHPLGAIMLPAVWSSALHALSERPAASAKALQFRNRALLLVLFELGLTPAELRGLTIHSLSVRTNGAGEGGWLLIDGEHVNHPRRMKLPAIVHQALQEWMSIRETTHGHAKTPILFSSRSGGQMSDENLLILVRGHILAAANACGHPPPARLGPQVVRNTRLVIWLNSGVPSTEAAIWAGLKNVKGFYHLRNHLLSEVRLTVRSERDDAPLERLAA